MHRRPDPPTSIIDSLSRAQAKEGWLSPETLRSIAAELGQPLHRVESVSTFYTHYRREKPRPVQIQVCRDLSCMLAGGEAACSEVREENAADDVQVEEVSCLGRCERAPVAIVNHEIVETEDLEAVTAAVDRARRGEPPQFDDETRVSWAADIYDGESEYFSTLRRMVTNREDPAQIVETLKESGLRGMGGAGFPTGLKWGFVRAESATPKYVICNADESEPGTFKDRAILDDLPYLVLEAMAIAGYVIGAEKGTVFIRHEYEPERLSIEAAIRDAYSEGHLGQKLFGTDFSFDIDVFVSPGGYILGEETALLECMEDKRGEPRNKPPFPGSFGLWGKPTLMNNVETLAHVTGILGRGLDWWRSLGRGDYAGHKFISVSGDVNEPGVYLIPVGSTLGELLERAGGMLPETELAAIAPGGASSNFIRPDKLDTEIDFQPLQEAGSMLGSGACVFVGDHHPLLEVGVNVARFFRNESCGKCVPCRVGSEKAIALLEGRDKLPVGSRELLEELNETMHQTSICGLGQVALAPLLSIIENFDDEIESE